MELISWNVNGLRANMDKGFIDWVKTRNPDYLCIQETKLQANQISLNLDLPNYQIYWNFAQKKGYSGVATFTKTRPISIVSTLGKEEFDIEGRFLQLEFDNFFLINLYFPNAQRELKRLDFKLNFNEYLLKYIVKLKNQSPKKSIILCGDFNVAHKEIDLKNPKLNENNAGFSPQERMWFSNLLQEGFIDSFRFFFPDRKEEYSWWTYRYNARTKNIGWRIDYFIVDKESKNNLENAFILKDVLGSDHAPIGIKFKNN